MNYQELYKQIVAKKSFLCVGLDPDMAKLPQHLLSCEYPIFEFNKAIIDATAPYAVAFKPNCAFYEAEGLDGWKQFMMTVEYIKKNYPDILVIADAKRGDIGNTAKKYAQCFFKSMDCDAVTLAPYMGADSINPFLEYDGKWAVVLALTSNKSADDFEQLSSFDENDSDEDFDVEPLFMRVIRKVMTFGSKDNIMFVVGATRPEKLAEIRDVCPDNFLLVPGVGAQGGTVADVAKYGLNDHCGLLVNSSRGIIYASSGEDFAEAAAAAAKQLAGEMSVVL